MGFGEENPPSPPYIDLYMCTTSFGFFLVGCVCSSCFWWMSFEGDLTCLMWNGRDCNLVVGFSEVYGALVVVVVLEVKGRLLLVAMEE